MILDLDEIRRALPEELREEMVIRQAQLTASGALITAPGQNERDFRDRFYDWLFKWAGERKS